MRLGATGKTLIDLDQQRSLRVDVLMVTSARAEFTRQSLPTLLDTCDEAMRVWIWHNGSDARTLRIVRRYLDHPAIEGFHHSLADRGTDEPARWMWINTTSPFVAKVDDNCLVPHGWAQQLRSAHVDLSDIGVLACWHFPESDLNPDLAARKIERLTAQHRVMVNAWTGSSGYMMKRRCIEMHGTPSYGENFNSYCRRLAFNGWINGWYFPLILQERLDDPRCPHALLKTQEDFESLRPHTAVELGIMTIEDWSAHLRASARALQSAPVDPRTHFGWRRMSRRGLDEIRDLAQRFRKTA